MRIDILSAVPELLASPLSHSIVQRAQDKNLVAVHVHNLRDYTPNKHRRIDDYPYGGGPGMVLQAEPLVNAIEALQAQRPYDQVIYLTPDGEPLQQARVNELALQTNLLLIAGHYKGIDQRVRDGWVTLEISLGDYVLSGGELPAAILTDAIVRLLPGVLGDETSALQDSFMDGLLDAPMYTRPEDFRGKKVPEVLLTGHEARIAAWRHQEALAKTRTRRPDLLPTTETNNSED